LALYDKIGSGYDINRKADPYITRRLLFHLHPVLRRMYLDLACGSGNYTIAFKESGIDVGGIDISGQMISLARQKDPSIDWVRGDTEALPFLDRSLAGATCILAIHHFKNLQRVFKEASRIVTERLVIFTATAEQVKGYWLNEYFPEAMRKSVDQMPSRNTIEKTLRDAGFNPVIWERYEIKNDLQDWFLYSGKHRPEMYLDPKIRLGISTFASLADAGEIKKGCDLLAADIRSGKIHQVTNSYNSRIGDYMFVVGCK
jgi:SAM-dependent methyltransferase